MKIKPVVSIILATYNREYLIRDTLDSISNQSYVNWECIIIDDGDTNETEKAISSNLIDKRFSYYKREQGFKKGLSGCRNMGLELAAGDYIIFFDDDDIIHPQNLEICLTVLKSFNVDFCRYDKKPFTNNFDPQYLTPIKKAIVPEKISRNKMDDIVMGYLGFASCTVMWNKMCFYKNRFNENLQYAEEWECYTRILTSGVEGISIDTVLYFNRKHENSNTGEFRNNDPIRKASKVKAIELVLDNLKNNNLLSQRLVKYFLQLSFLLKNSFILEKTLKYSNAGFFKTWKYKLGFRFYSILRPILKLKGKLISELKIGYGRN